LLIVIKSINFLIAFLGEKFHAFMAK